MSVKALLPLLLLAAPSWAGPLDDLRAVLDGPSGPYRGEVTVTRGKVERRLRVSFAPPGRYRRERLGADGRPELVAVSDGKTEWVADLARSRAWRGPASGALDKISGPEEDFERLAENYDVSEASGGALGRAARVFELRAKEGGVLRRRLWADPKTGIVLRSQSFRPDGALASEERFTRLELEAPDPAAFRYSPPPGVVARERLGRDYLGLDEAKAASGQEPRLPSWLPAGYSFESLDVLPRKRGNVLHYRFTDGVDVLSLFQCPKGVRLGFGKRPVEKMRLAGGPARRSWTRDGTVLSWENGRMVLVGPLPDGILERVAESVR